VWPVSSMLPCLGECHVVNVVVLPAQELLTTLSSWWWEQKLLKLVFTGTLCPPHSERGGSSKGTVTLCIRTLVRACSWRTSGSCQLWSQEVDQENCPTLWLFSFFFTLSYPNTTVCIYHPVYEQFNSRD